MEKVFVVMNGTKPEVYSSKQAAEKAYASASFTPTIHEVKVQKRVYTKRTAVA